VVTVGVGLMVVSWRVWAEGVTASERSSIDFVCELIGKEGVSSGGKPKDVRFDVEPTGPPDVEEITSLYSSHTSG